MRPLLAQATALARDARPGVRLLGPASSRLASALQRSAPTLGRARRLAPPVEQVVGEARTLAERPATTGALQRLNDVVRGAKPLLTYLNPMQTKCNALGLWTRNVPSLGSEGDPLGGWFRFVAVTQVNEVLPHAERSPNLHYNPLPDTGTGGECEAGNSAFADGQQVGPVPGRQPLATEPTIPGSLAEKVAAEGDG